uniref:C-type lectin domain-containing protein n=1 Tax=Paramormyrops kingsleyae TaxID=1676925 RepID=A0A3B3R0X4_9TELE
ISIDLQSLAGVYLILIGVFVCFCSSLTGFCKATCPPGWINFKNRCFKYIAVGKTWIDSELNCLSSGGNLASIHSEEEFQFIKALIKSRDSAENPTWIGLTDSSKEGTWLWTDGSKVDFTKWNSGEPNNVNGGENCVHTNWSGKGDFIRCLSSGWGPPGSSKVVLIK